MNRLRKTGQGIKGGRLQAALTFGYIDDAIDEHAEVVLHGQAKEPDAMIHVGGAIHTRAQYRDRRDVMHLQRGDHIGVNDEVLRLDTEPRVE